MNKLLIINIFIDVNMYYKLISRNVTVLYRYTVPAEFHSCTGPGPAVLGRLSCFVNVPEAAEQPDATVCVSCFLFGADQCRPPAVNKAKRTKINLN